MRYKIYSIRHDSDNYFASNRYEFPVYPQSDALFTELGFNGRDNDFATEQDALNFIAGNSELARMALTILPFIRG